MTKLKIFVPAILAILLAGSGSYGFPGRTEVSDLQEISYLNAESGLEVSVRIRGEFSHDVFKLTEPERLVFDISPIDTISAASQTNINLRGVLRVRTGKFKAGVARVVFDLKTAAVNYSIVRTNDGLKVTFWEEGEKAQLPGETEIPPVSKPREARPEAKPGSRIESALFSGENERRFFVQIGGGAGLFLKSMTPFNRSFPFFDKEGNRTETYDFKLNMPSYLSVGGYIKSLPGPIKVGLGIEYWNFKSDRAFEFTVPHPFLADSPRTLGLADTSRSYFTSVSAFGLFQIFTAGRLKVSAGPEIGFAFGKYKFLDAVEFDDQPPFMEDDVTITSVTYLEKSISSLWPGLQAALEYSFSPKFTLLLNLRVLYLDPKIEELSSTFTLSQAHALIGFQYRFSFSLLDRWLGSSSR